MISSEVQNKNLNTTLEKYSEDISVFFTNVPLPTANSAAKYLGTTDDRIVKTLLIKTSDGRFCAVVVRGDDQLDEKKLKKKLAAKKIRFLKNDEVEIITGYPPGGVPPLAFPKELTLLMDSAVMEKDKVIGGGGSVNSLMEIKTEVFNKIPEIIKCDLVIKSY